LINTFLSEEESFWGKTGSLFLKQAQIKNIVYNKKHLKQITTKWKSRNHQFYNRHAPQSAAINQLTCTARRVPSLELLLPTSVIKNVLKHSGQSINFSTKNVRFFSTSEGVA